MLAAASRVEGGAPDIEELIIAAEPTQVPVATEPVAADKMEVPVATVRVATMPIATEPIATN